jgi:hypothetical protein
MIKGFPFFENYITILLATIATSIPFQRYGRQSDFQQSRRRFGQGGIGTQAIYRSSEIQG